MSKKQLEVIKGLFYKSEPLRKRFNSLKRVDCLDYKTMEYREFSDDMALSFYEGTFKTIKKRNVIHSLVLKVSASGMSRTARFYTCDKSEIISLNYYINIILGTKVNGDNDLVLKGCGMDMLFNEVYNLSSVLFGDGYYLTNKGI